MPKEACHRAERGRMEPIRKKGVVPGLQQNRRGELEYLTYPMLEQTGIVTHMISTRLGGVSRGMFATMNYSYMRGDEKAAVDENFRRTAQVFGTGPDAFVCSDQTHTTNVRVVSQQDRGKGVVRPKDYRDVDGLVTNVPGLILSTFYADCVPLLFVDPVNGAIGCSHSGWRGTVAEMGRVTVETMAEEYGSRPEDLIAAIGPSICRDCYEVGKEVAEPFWELFSQKRYAFADPDRIVARGRERKYRLDLWKANEAVLLAAGLLKEHICMPDLCTCENPDYLFSHRASKGRRGNFGAFLMLRQ